jgi:PST family polysaccharide transporter
MTNLRQKAVSGMKWSAISQAGRLGTQLLTTIILARLLDPSDFGLVEMAMVALGFVAIFKDLGTTAAIIQRKELSGTLLSSVFWVNVFFGLLIMIVLFALAPLIGLFYRELRVVTVLRVLSISFFISGLGMLQQALLERRLAFDTVAKLEALSTMVGAIVGIVLAVEGVGVWSLVFQSLVTVATLTMLLWWSSPWRPQWSFRWSEVKTISQFSLNLTGFSIINFFIRSADNLLIGRYLGAQELGYYTLAYRILLFPIQNISAVTGRVMYPVLSSMQDDNQRFAAAYLRVIAVISLITFPLMMGVVAVAKPLVLTFFGEKWQPVILLMVIFAPVGLIQSIGTTVGAIYQAKGRADWMLRWGVVSGIIIVAAFLIGLRDGIVGVATAYAIASFILFYPSFSIPFRLLGLKFSELPSLLWPSFINSVLMLIALTIFKTFLPASMSNVVVLALTACAGVIFYGLASWLTNQEQVKELWGLLGLNRTNLNEAG